MSRLTLGREVGREGTLSHERKVARKADLANDEDFSRDITRGGGLGGLNLAEELLEDPHEGVVVARAEDLGHKGALFDKKLSGQLEGLEHERC